MTALLAIPAVLALVTPSISDELSGPFTATKLLGYLESGLISEGMNDAVFRLEGSGLHRDQRGQYTVFSAPGLDTTDGILMPSVDGSLFYANYGSCSDSKTYFRSTPEYFRYVLSID